MLSFLAAGGSAAGGSAGKHAAVPLSGSAACNWDLIYDVRVH